MCRKNYISILNIYSWPSTMKTFSLDVFLVSKIFSLNNFFCDIWLLLFISTFIDFSPFCFFPSESSDVNSNDNDAMLSHNNWLLLLSLTEVLFLMNFRFQPLEQKNSWIFSFLVWFENFHETPSKNEKFILFCFKCWWKFIAQKVVLSSFSFWFKTFLLHVFGSLKRFNEYSLTEQPLSNYNS